MKLIDFYKIEALTCLLEKTIVYPNRKEKTLLQLSCSSVLKIHKRIS